MKAVIAADLHLRTDRPTCRRETDQEWENTQASSFRALCEAAVLRKAPLALVGDIFDSPSVPHRLISMFIETARAVPNGVFILPGQHDLPYHSWKNVRASAFGNIWALIDGDRGWIQDIIRLGARKIWGAPKPELLQESEILFLHTLVFPSAKDLPPNVDAQTAAELLAEYPKARWIFTGDYHRAFHYEKNGRHVVNPGCMTRQAADFKDYRPQAWYVDTEKEVAEALPLPDTLSVVADDYLRREEEREARIEAFVERVSESGGVSLDFVANVEAELTANKKTLEPLVVDTIRELMEGGE